MLSCTHCQATLFPSNNFCPYCRTENLRAISKASDLEQQMVFDGLGGTEELATQVPCTKEKHDNIVSGLKLLQERGDDLIKRMEYCPDCGNPLPKI